MAGDQTPIKVGDFIVTNHGGEPYLDGPVIEITAKQVRYEAGGVHAGRRPISDVAYAGPRDICELLIKRINTSRDIMRRAKLQIDRQHLDRVEKAIKQAEAGE